VTFAVAAASYDRFMGRYSSRLAPVFADFAGIEAGMRVVDVGCGPGALTAVLVERVGAGSVVAADPSEPFVAAARERFPGVDVHEAPAEALPLGDGEFDAALAQLVVSFMADPAAGIAEMARVTKGGGVVAACVWDIAGASPLTPFWRGARAAEAGVGGETDRAGVREGDLVARFRTAGFRDVAGASLEVSLVHETFEDWWEPFTLGVGPAGAHVARLAPDARDALRERCRADLGDGPFAIPSRAWAARGGVV
jgi:SAM-dependent methyltransferase